MDESLAISTRVLTKFYRGRFWALKKPAALDQLTLDIPLGRVFGFLGPNGAGKTTTIRCLIGLIKPTSGTARVLGKDLGDTSIKERIGFLPDTPAFASHLTAMEFLRLCARLLRIPRAEQRSRIDETLDRVHMTEHRNSRLGGFSRGMLQRIGIAQALLNRPRLLILDEPLAGLDPHGRQELKTIIQTQKNEGVTVFFCSHILSDVETMCDAVAILDHGRIRASGSLSSLLSQQGLRVRVPRGHADLLGRLMPLCSASHKVDEEAYLLDFDAAGQARVEEFRSSFPDDVTVTPHLESLETYFFRTLGRRCPNETQNP